MDHEQQQQQPPRVQYSEQRIDLLQCSLISQEVEIGRHLAEIRYRHGHVHEALQAFQRLAERFEDAAVFLASTRGLAGDESDAFATMETVLLQQQQLLLTQMEEVEQSISREFRSDQIPPAEPLSPAASPPTRDAPQASPVPPPAGPQEYPFPPGTQNAASQPDFPTIAQPPVSLFPPVGDDRGLIFASAAPRRASPPPQAAFGTQAPSQAPAAEIVQTLSPARRGQHVSEPRAAHDMSGAVHIRRQLDEQEESQETARDAKWWADMSKNISPTRPQNSRKRQGDELPGTPGKRQQTETSRARGLRGGKEEGNKWFRELFKKLNPFPSKDRNGKENKPQHPFGNSQINSDTSQAHYYDKNVEGLLGIASLKSRFHPAHQKEKAVRDQLEDLITLYNSMTTRFSRQTASSPDGETQRQIETLLGAFRKIPVEHFDTPDTYRTLDGLATFCETKLRAITKTPEDEEERDAALANAAAMIGECHDRLEKQTLFTAKVFVDGEKTGGLFANWINGERRHLADEAAFGERARQTPKLFRRGRAHYHVV
ncbi:hypothetical protein CKAH01_03313 [Colletotrichum kahawae]|uniref:Uncharacterized protein n=1 Tax=Colletotrichum kahawae TaxID=34407 RepID=A0AAD9YRW3_COLKA|nr:hypothetical protein CKAH01_03313 [Colletotrichum kahawae]